MDVASPPAPSTSVEGRSVWHKPAYLESKTKFKLVACRRKIK
jgi:hypothetical protein